MNYLLSTSDSLIGSLCRELQYIKLRKRVITSSLRNCQSKLLIERLNKELKLLNSRVKSIKGTVTNLQIQKGDNDLSLAFLLELVNRSLILREII